MSRAEGDNRQPIEAPKKFKKSKIYEDLLNEGRNWEVRADYYSDNRMERKKAKKELKRQFNIDKDEYYIKKVSLFPTRYVYLSDEQSSALRRKRTKRRWLVFGGAITAGAILTGLTIQNMNKKEESLSGKWTSHDLGTTNGSQSESTAPPKIEITPLTGTLEKNIGYDAAKDESISELTATLQSGKRLILISYNCKQSGGAFVGDRDKYLSNTDNTARINVWDGNTFYPDTPAPVPSQILVWPIFDKKLYPNNMDILFFLETQGKDSTPSYELLTTQETDSQAIIKAIKATRADKLGKNPIETVLTTLLPTKPSDAGLSLNSVAQ